MRERPQFRYVCRASVRAAGRSWQGQLAGDDAILAKSATAEPSATDLFETGGLLPI